MATQITTLTAGYILIQAGHGIPNHAAPKGSQFTDVDTATLYFNKNGLSDWEINIDVSNTGSTIGINTFSSFSSSTIGQGSVIATTSNDNLIFSGINLSILVDNTNQILTLSAATPSDYTFTGGTVNGLTNFTNGLSATTISATTFYGNGANLTGVAKQDTYLTGGTYNNGTATFVNNTGGTFTVSGFKTSDIFVTGGTYDNSTGVTTFTNNTGGTFTVSGYFKPTDDIYTTGMTFNASNYDLSITRNDGTTYSQSLAILASDMTITGGTYNNSTGVATFTNNTGGTFSVSGFLTGMTDTYTTGFTYSDNTLTLKRNANQPDLSVMINSMTGLTVNGTISTTTISATTYQNLPTDITVTGGTYSNGTTTFTNNTGGTFTVSGFKTSDLVVTGGTYNSGSILFTNNTGGTFNVTGLYTGYTAPIDVTVTGGTYNTNSGIATFTNNTGGTFTLTGFKTSDLVITGGTYSNGSATFTNNTGGTFTVSGFKTDDVFITGGTYSNGAILFTNNTGGTFNVNGLYTGYTTPIDITVTGGTYSNGTASFTNNTGGTFTVSGFKTSDLVVTGGTYTSGTATFTNNTGGTFTVSGFKTSDLVVTGGTYSNGSILFTNNTGGTFNVSGLYTGYTAPVDVFTTGGTYSNGTATFTNNTGGTFNVSGFKTSDLVVTGGTYNNTTGVTTFTNNTGGTFTVNGYYTGYTLTSSEINSALGYTPLSAYTDTIVTGGTYSNGTTIFTNNTGGTFTVSGFKTDDLVVTGGTYNNGSILFTNNTGGTFNVTGLYTGYTAPIDVTVTGGTYSSGTATFTNNTGGTFSVAGFKTDDIYTTGMTFNAGSYDLSITRNDGTSFTQSLAVLASDMTITGGTYNANSGVATFTNNTGGTFNVSGFLTGMTDTYATGLTFSNNVLTLKQTNNQADLDILINNLSGLTVNGSLSATTFYGNGSNLTGLVTQDTVVTGGTYNSGSILFTNNTGGTFNVSGLYTGYTAPIDVYTTGATYSSNTFTYTNNTGGTFSTLFNTMTGLTITGNLTVTGGTSSLFSGNSSSTMVRIVQTGSGNAFSVEDAASPDINPFIIDTNGIVGIGTNSPSGYNARLVVAATISGEYGVRSTGFNNHGMLGQALSIGYAGVYGISSTDGVGNGIGVYGRAEAADTGYSGQIWVGGKFEAVGDSEVGSNYSLWLLDGTEAVNKVLVSQTSDGKANWSSTLSGLTGVYTNTISATTYSNLPIDIRVTGGTYSSGTATFTNNTGGTFTVTGFSTGGGSTFTGGTVTGPTNFTNGLTATTISATTYYNLPTDISVTGGTYSSGTATFTNNTGGTFTVTGFSTGGSTTFTGGTVTGATNFTNGLTANTMSATTYYGDGSNLTGISAVATEFVVNCRNQSGSDMYRGQVVYINSSTGNKPTIQLSIATGETTSARTFGVLKNDIANNAFGDVVTIGSITNLDTRTSATHPFTNDTLNDGDTVYLSPITQGFITNVKPSAPNHLVYIGKVIRTSPTNGYIEYQIMNGFELDELHNVKVNDITVGDLLTYSGYNGTNVWVNSKTLNGSYTITGNTTVGGSVSATTLLTNGFRANTDGITATTISATTYFNLPTDVRVTGGTYTNGTATFTNNTGGTFTVTGFSTGGTSSTDTFVTGATYSNNTFTYRNNTGGTFNVLFNTVTGLTSSGTISTSVLSATTYQNLPTDVRVTGGTYSSGTATFTNNTGGTFTVTGFSTGGGSAFTGGTVSGATYFTGGVSANTLTASGTGQNILTVIGSGNSTTSPIFSVVGSQGELFSVTDSLTGSLFSVNDISGLPILEVFSDNTTLMGSYQAPSLNTTKKVSLTAGTNTVYSIPTSGYTGAFFDYTVISSTGARAGTIMSIWSGTTAQSTDVSTNDIGTTAGITFSVAVVGSNAVLSSSATTTGWTLKTIIRSI